MIFGILRFVSGSRLRLAGLLLLSAGLPIALASIAPSDKAGTVFDPGREAGLILFRRGAVDTTGAPRDLLMMDLGESDARRRTRIIQFAGPVRPEWIASVDAAGCELVGYLPNNAYIIRGLPSEYARLADLPIRWAGEFPALFKVDPRLDPFIAAGNGSVDVEIELVDGIESDRATGLIEGASLATNAAPRRFLNFVVLSVTLPASKLFEIAALDEVLFIGPGGVPTLNDERAAQVVAGNLDAERTKPAGPGYLDWLDSLGLGEPPDFLIDFVDSGLDRGTATPIHPDFLDSSGQTRVVYILNYDSTSFPEDRRGHGTLVASIACGYKAGNYSDVEGYLLGLGVAPYARFGASRIFSHKGSIPFTLSFTEVASAAYAAGARISNNSWGRGGNDYDVSAQEFDALVRDAQPGVPGNQEMTFVFPAGNNGARGISSPGTAKNVITVGASENFRPEGLDSCNLDGLGGIGPDGADSAMDMLRFSSAGPTEDGRAKPDISAPGTHVYGAGTQARFFFGEGICPGVPLFQPPGQGLYTWSSGTSLAVPHATGAAALIRQFFTTRKLLEGGRAPSPAMTKAFLVSSTQYLTGENAGGNLPAPQQGWGLIDLTRAFDESGRVLIDQTVEFTESGQKIEVRGSLADRSRPLRVTLAWSDAPGSLAAAPWVNDLDLEVRVGSSTLYLGNNFSRGLAKADGLPDRRNNVESVFLAPEMIPEGYEGTFTITVRAVNIAGDGVPGNDSLLDQDFALVVYNVTDPIEPPKVPVVSSVTYEKKTLVITGQEFSAAARVEVNGRLVTRELEFDAPANSLSVTAKPRKLGLIRGEDNQIIVIEGELRSAPFTLRL